MGTCKTPLLAQRAREKWGTLSIGQPRNFENHRGRAAALASHRGTDERVRPYVSYLHVKR